MVNCKFKAMTPKWGNAAIDAGCSTDCVIDYNFYAAGNVTSNLPQDVEEGTTNPYLSLTQKNKNVFTDIIDLHSPISAQAGDAATNPLFVNYDINAVSLTTIAYNEAWNFHVAANSPVLQGAYAGSQLNMLPFFSGNGLTVANATYRTDVLHSLISVHSQNNHLARRGRMEHLVASLSVFLCVHQKIRPHFFFTFKNRNNNAKTNHTHFIPFCPGGTSPNSRRLEKVNRYTQFLHVQRHGAQWLL